MIHVVFSFCWDTQLYIDTIVPYSPCCRVLSEGIDATALLT